MSNDNEDPFRKFNRRVQRQSERRQNQEGWGVVVVIAIAIAILAFWAFK